MDTPSSADDLLGRMVGGRYRIESALRRGGMGQVYVAHDTARDDARVAVKVVRQALLEDAQALARFKREARLVTELQHENIVTSLAAGEDGGLLWIAMELLEGQSLRERLDGRGRMSWQETLPIVEQIVRALQAAHDKGVIHRDLKPENVMLMVAKGATPEGDGVRAKLLDFGVAKQAHVEGGSAGTSNMTGTGLIVGTPGYVAPEVVLEGKTDDPRSDLYALGVTWFEMLTAQKPFTAKTAFALAMRHAHEPAPTPTSLVPYSPVPAPIESLVLRLMAKSPDERPASAQGLLTALATLAEESQLALTSPTPSLGGHENTVTATDMQRPSTGVVPFKATPSPGASATPATALRAAGPAMTPPPDMAQLVAAIPKTKLALGAAVFVLGIVVIAVGAVVAFMKIDARRRPPAETAASLPTPPVAPPVIAVVAPPPAAPPPVVIPSPPPEQPVEKLDRKTRREERKAKRAERKEEILAGQPAESGSTGEVVFKTAKTTQVFLDGSSDWFDSGPKPHVLRAGQHTAEFRNADGRVKIVPFVVVAGKSTAVGLDSP